MVQIHVSPAAAACAMKGSSFGLHIPKKLSSVLVRCRDEVDVI